MTAARKLSIATITVGAVLAALIVAALLISQTDWFKNRVRERIITEAERLSGGRVEIGSFKYDWHTLRVELGHFVLHGIEQSTDPPLFKAERIHIALRLISPLQRDIDIAEIQIQRPEIFLTIGPDGSSNLPGPRVFSIDDLLRLKIGKFMVRDGAITYNDRRIPVDLWGRNLRANLAYQNHEYAGKFEANNVAVESDELRYRDLSVSSSIAVGNNRLEIRSARVQAGASTLRVAGAINDFVHPKANLEITAHGFPADLRRAIDLPISDQGTVDFRGKIRLQSEPRWYQLQGNLHGNDLQYRGPSLRISNFAVATDVDAMPGRISLAGLHLSALNGAFDGSAEISENRQISVSGKASHFPIESLASASGQKLPVLTGSVSGPVHASGTVTLDGIDNLTLEAKLDLTPGHGGLPIAGSVDLRYNQLSSTLTLAESDFSLGSTHLRISGVLGKALDLHATSSNLEEVAAGLRSLGAPLPQPLPVSLNNGTASFNGTIQGTSSEPHIMGDVKLERVQWKDEKVDHLSAVVDVQKSSLTFSNLDADNSEISVRGGGTISLLNWTANRSSHLDTTLTVRGQNLAKALEGLTPAPKTNLFSAALTLKGTLSDPHGAANLEASGVDVSGETLDHIVAAVAYGNSRVTVTRADILAAHGRVSLSGNYVYQRADWANGEVQFRYTAANLNLASIKHAQTFRKGIGGQLDGIGTGTAKIVNKSVNLTSLSADSKLSNVSVDGRPYGSATLMANTNGSLLAVNGSANLNGAKLTGTGQWRLSDDYAGHANVEIGRVSLATLYGLISTSNNQNRLPFDGFVEGSIQLTGPLNRFQDLRAETVLTAVQINALRPVPPLTGAQSKDLVLRNAAPIVLDAGSNGIEIRTAIFEAKDTTLRATGRFSFAANTAWDLNVTGNVNLTILQIFNPDLQASGNSIIRTTVRGSLSDPDVQGRLEVRNASFFLKDIPNGLDNANGLILFDRDRATVENLTAAIGGGRIEFERGSFVGFGGPALVYSVHAAARDIRYRPEEGISLTGSAALNLVGTSDRSLLSGTITLEKAAFNPRTDVGTLLAASARPIAVTAGPDDYLRGLQFDLRIQSAQNLEIQTFLTRNLQAEANLTVRGSVNQPAVLGTITVNSGEIDFFGNKYTINRGEVRFINAAKVEPVINMDLETRVRGINVDITFAGPLNKLSFAYHSDPPLDTNQIVALLAVGRVPTAAGGLASAQTTTNTSYLATGSNSLLGQAITPDSGRLQRFFGVSHIKIDPQYTDVTAIPQARLTMEQQLSKQVTLTYITNLTGAEEQIVRVELSLTQHWSVIALRDANGAFGIDFQYRKRFR